MFFNILVWCFTGQDVPYKPQEYFVKTRKCEPDASAKVVKICERHVSLVFLFLNCFKDRAWFVLLISLLILHKDCFEYSIEESGGYWLVVRECFLWGKLTKSHKLCEIFCVYLWRIWFLFLLFIDPVFSPWGLLDCS